MRGTVRVAALGACVLCAPPISAQPVPQPFPRPAQPSRPPATAPAEPAAPRPAPPGPPVQPGTQGHATAATPPATPARASATAPAEEAPPSEALLGMAVYPNCVFLRSYAAGMGQRYYLFGCDASYVDLVGYYRTLLRTRGEQVYDVPPVFMFEVGRFREDAMAFPPGVTVKDYASSGTGGYLDARLSAGGRRYPTVLQFVPVPEADRKR